MIRSQTENETLEAWGFSTNNSIFVHIEVNNQTTEEYSILA